MSAKELQHVPGATTFLKLADYVEINGELFHRSRTEAKAFLAKNPESAQASKRRRGRKGVLPVCFGGASKPSVLPVYRAASKIPPEILALYAAAKAVLVVPGKPRSTNQLKWKHWSIHHRARNEDADRIQTASWLLPLGTLPPEGPTNWKVRLEFVKYGGRIMDKINFAEGCKGILDELVSLELLKDDSPDWLDHDYHQVRGGTPRVEILFLSALSRPLHQPGDVVQQK